MEEWLELVKSLGEKTFLQRHPGFFLVSTDEGLEMSTTVQTLVPEAKKKGDTIRRRFDVFWVAGAAGGPVTVGRSRSCDISFRHPSVSKLHAMIEPEAKVLRVIDQGSRNGTQLNGKPLQPHEEVKAAPHDRLHFGSVQTLVLPNKDALELLARMV
jgi:hypothetical protein